MIYGGNIDYWKRFANAIKMRLAIRIADRDQNRALQLIDEAVVFGTYTSNGDNAYFQIQPAPPANNPLNEDRKTRSDFAVSNTLIKALTVKPPTGTVIIYDPSH